MKRAHLMGFRVTTQPACGRTQANYLIAMNDKYITCKACKELVKEQKRQDKKKVGGR